jgi:acyl transferase domain-containing protein
MKEHFVIGLGLPLMRDHRVLGRHILPGLAYVDLVYQLFRDQGYDLRRLELSNLRIYRPVAVTASEELVLAIECTAVDSSHWRVGAAFAPAGDREDSARTVCMTAIMQLSDRADLAEKMEPRDVVKASRRSFSLEEIYSTLRRRDLLHGPFMRAEGQVHVTDEAVYVDARIGTGTTAESSDLMFHPALLDACAIGAGYAVAPDSGGAGAALFLPFSFQSFHTVSLLQHRVFARIPRNAMRSSDQTASLTIEFFDDSGVKIATLTGLNGRRAVESALFVSLQHAATAPGIPVPSAVTIEDLAGGSAPTSIRSAENLLQQILAARLPSLQGAIDTNQGYSEMGLDSAGLLEILDTLEGRLEVTLDPTLMFEFPTIAALARHLAGSYGHYVSRATSGLPASSLFGTAGKPTDPLAVGAEPAPAIRRDADHDDIAIIGMAGRFPLARNLSEFWEKLKSGTDCITEIPAQRWDWRAFEGLSIASGRKVSRWGGFIDSPESFDAGFFRISPREADMLDPQERVFLETCWEAIEDAGYTPENLVSAKGQDQRRAAGVFVGVMYKDYALIGADATGRGHVVPFSLNCAGIPNRVSYFCNFHGPSLAVDTVCSSSLTAMHLALESLRSGECEVAIAGGVNLSLHPGKYITCAMVGVHSSDGRCHTFGKGGDGYASAEGVGAVILKPLRSALADGDEIYAVVKASQINHGGAVSGFTVPSPVAQCAMITSCLERGGIDPRTISYVEAQGTGTSLGDPVEIRALSRAFGARTSDLQFCAIGSVKSNIGHAEGAAGISGVIKATLQLKHRTLVSTLHAEEASPYIDWKKTPFFVQRATGPWALPVESSNRRRAAVNSFGASGSNAHLILEEAPSINPRDLPAGNPELAAIFPLSAKSEERLREYALRLAQFLSANDPELSRVAYTLQTGRRPMEYRLAVVALSTEGLVATLRDLDAAKHQPGCTVFVGRARPGEEHGDNGDLSVDAAALARGWIERNRPDKVAELWSRGMTVDWSQLYGGRRPRKISLPTYPFKRAPHWLIPTLSKSGAAGDEVDVDRTAARSISRSPVATATAAGQTREQLMHDCSSYLKSLVGAVLKMSPHQIDSDEALDNYGIDSLAAGQLARLLSERVPTVSKTVFFEYPTIQALARYLLDSHLNDLLATSAGEGQSPGPRISANEREVTSDTPPALAPDPAPGSVDVDSATNQTAKAEGGEIAIIGMAGRYPKARNLDEFWQNILHGADCISEVPAGRPAALHGGAGPEGQAPARWGGFLDELGEFDGPFFGFSSLAVERLSQEEQQLLEVVWHVLENGGYTRDSLRRLTEGNVGVFVGATGYTSLGPNSPEGSIGSLAAVANRLSHFFDLSGPCLAIDTMCSSSSTAIHLACRSLVQGDCEVAIAAGVNLYSTLDRYDGLRRAGMVASRFDSRSFAAGEGFLPAEGVGAVLLKPLAKALKDGDLIRAVIKASSLKHSGRSTGFATPNPTAQAQLMRDALRRAGIDSRAISYVESAANGSPVGDSLECAALRKVFDQPNGEEQFCALGSVKSFVGHPEAASGICQLTKVTLQLQHRKLVPSATSFPMNPDLGLASSSLRLQTATEEWRRPLIFSGRTPRELPRMALINSFGAGGSYVTLIVEEHPAQTPADQSETPPLGTHLVVLSAADRDGLRQVAERLAVYLETCSEESLADIAYTLQVGREAMEARLAIVGSSAAAIIHGLKSHLGTQAQSADAPSVFLGDSAGSNPAVSSLLTGSLGRTLLDAILSTRSAEQLAVYWVNGGKVSWEALYRDRPMRKVELPAYPFRRPQRDRPEVGHAKPEPTSAAAMDSPGFSRRSEYVAPQSDIEYKLAHIWGDVLRLKDIGSQDNFFDLGGDSLLATQVLTQVRDAFNVELSVHALFEAPTLAELGEQIDLMTTAGTSLFMPPSGETELLRGTI